MSKKHRRVPASLVVTVPAENEVRVDFKAGRGACVKRAMEIFESGSDSVVISAYGQAIKIAVEVVEIVKRKKPDLHQVPLFTSGAPTNQ